MSDSADFRDLQYRFTAHVRDPASNPPPDGIDERRMRVYRELLFNNTRSFLDSGFPVLSRIYGEQAWERLARSFFARHRCQTPYFLEISREFLRYLSDEHEPTEDDPAFLLELAHYEWVELALSVADTGFDMDAIDGNGDLLAGRPVLSPLAWPLSYHYPVHVIGPGNQPTEPPASTTHLLVYRNDDDEVHFLELNAVSARLVALLRDTCDLTGRKILEQIADELGHVNREVVLQGGQQVLEDLRRRGALLGTRKD